MNIGHKVPKLKTQIVRDPQKLKIQHFFFQSSSQDPKKRLIYKFFPQAAYTLEERLEKQNREDFHLL